MHRRAHHSSPSSAWSPSRRPPRRWPTSVGQQIRIQGQRPMGPRTGPRDNQAPQTGTARLRGRVVGGESGQALRRAIVRLQGQEFREGRVASTDEDGRWEIKDLPAGRYNLTASKGGYVQLNYGQRRPFERGRPLELADGQTLENVNFNLPARIGHRRPDRRRVRRADRRRDGLGAPLPDLQRTSPAGAGGPLRLHRRHGPLPDLRPGARRLLRQRDAAADGHDGHRVERRHDQLRAHLLPGHGQLAASRPHHASVWARRWRASRSRCCRCAR